MEQDGLTREISSLSLNQPVQQSGSRKSRRPNRAYHNLATGISAPATPFATQSPGPDGFLSNNGSQTFSPMGQPQSSVSTPGLVAGSPSMMGQQQPGFAAQYGSPEPDAQGGSSHLVAAQRWEDQVRYLTRTYDTARDSVAPLPTTQFYGADHGVCDPRFMSVSMNCVPADERLRSATKLPLGLTIQPFARIIPEEAVPVVDNAKDSGPLRCRRCRAYVNPGFRIGYDSTALCNICEVKTQVPIDTYPPLAVDPYGTVNGANPELVRGCVDFLVPDVYNAIQGEKPLPLHYVFLVDISLLANENGSSTAVLEGVKTCIEHISDFQPNCKIAIMAFDSRIRFFNLSPTLESAQEYIIGDLNDVFLPFCEGLFVSPQESARIIDDTLKKIMSYISMGKLYHVVQNCYGSALQAAKLALDTVTKGQGGKIICSLNSMPTVGNGNLTLRKDDATKKHMKCDNEFYTKLGHEFARSYISLDLFLTTSVFIDMVTVGYPVEATCGTLKYYPNFIQDRDEFALVNDMVQHVSSIVGYQALLKVRSSTDVSIYQYYLESAGNTDRDPMLPVLTTDTTVDVLLKLDQKLKIGNTVSFQAALLYTDIDGNRKVRSINSNAKISGNIREIFQFVDQNVAMRIMIKDVISSLGDCDFNAIRKTIDNKMVDVLTQYKALAGVSLSTQLVLPDALKTLPTFMLAFEKSPLMAPNAHSTRGNDRCYDLYHFKTLNSAQLSYKLYPQIVPLHVLLEESDLTFYDTAEKLLQVSTSSIENLTVRNAHASITNGGCYLIFQGEKVYLWFNENTNRMLLLDLLQVDETIPVSQISLFGASLPQLPTQVNEKAHAVIKNWCQITNKSTLPIELLRPNIDQYYSSVMGQILCEDKSINKIESHDNYLVQLHRLIQEKLKKDDYIKINHSSASHNGNATQEDMHQKFVQF
ncbi:hypothetical protein HG537_0E00650 [Torulaspora globosa]|uniref:Uncharacterized protein n=1 Tax=Torulaspora globosa TaxID=48254 RepID=A0A7H9HWF8_9SACH|nr:hypothetical protein HG537_0E00650 [Torulaspora sp. CBS 2947]